MNRREHNMGALVLRAAAVAVVIVGLAGSARAQELPIPKLPNLPPVSLPEEADPALKVVDRPISTACAAPSVFGLVMRLVGGALGVPIPDVDINDVSQPLYTACGIFPVPTEHTSCAIDGQVMGSIADQAGSTPIPVSLPDPAGAIVEIVMDAEAALHEYSAGAAPAGVGDALHEGLDCETTSLVSRGGSGTGDEGEVELPPLGERSAAEVRSEGARQEPAVASSRVPGRSTGFPGRPGTTATPDGSGEVAGEVAMEPLEASSSGLSGLRFGMAIVAATLLGPALVATLKGMARSARS